MRRVTIALVAAMLGVAACGSRSENPATRAKLAALPIPTTADTARLQSLPTPYRDADPAAGRAAFVLCADCHGLARGSPETNGPNLAGVFGAPAASRSSYGYSPALKAAAITWDARHLDQWIFNPHEMIPATRMSFIGIRNDKKRRDLIAYLIAVAGGPQSTAKQ